MGSTSFKAPNFLGGEWSQSAQGQTELPAYRTALNVCLNTIPIEAGAALRRPGTRHCGLTRGGAAARVITFDFEQAFPYEMEFSDSFLRFFAGGVLVTTNDTQIVSSISAANPAVVATLVAHNWSSSNSVVFAVNNALLQARAFLATVLSPTTFSIADAITGAAIDGSTLGAFTAGTVSRVLEIATPYASGSWGNLRSVQAETTAVLLNGTQPQILTVESLPTALHGATFALNPSNFLDGPYLDPIKGSYITSSALSGVVTLTLSFQPYSASVAYDLGAYVTSGGAGYRSLITANQNHNPAASPTQWLAVVAGDPINDGAGFTTADVGRLVRLFSEPPLWDPTATYAAKQTVAYTNGVGGYGYWTATAAIATAGIQPGTSTLWAANATGAIWTWGRILSVSAAGLKAPESAMGTFVAVATAFDGNPSKSFASSANVTNATLTVPVWQPIPLYSINQLAQYGGLAWQKNANPSLDPNELLPPPGNPLWTFFAILSNISFDVYAGQFYAAGSAISSATVTPTADVGFTNSPQGVVTLNLRAKNTAPASPSDGTLLGSTGPFGNTLSPVSITSSNAVTLFNYVWVEMLSDYLQPLPDDGSHLFTAQMGTAQVQFYTPNVANGSVVSLQIVGTPLLYANACRLWRLGTYGGSNGWPTCGTYHESRLWLAGVLGNRIDSSKSNDIFNFEPTGTSGVVADNNAITAVFDGPDVNTIFWMTPDQQGIIAGTQAGEWLVSPAGPGAMSPTNIAARRVTKIGCANIEPKRTEHTLALVQKFGRKIMEYFADVQSGKFTAPNLSVYSKHLTAGDIQEIAYQQELAPIIWWRTGGGLLRGMTYKRDTLATAQGPTFIAAHRHLLGSGRTVASLAVGASVNGNVDSLYMVTADSNGVYHVEMMTNLLDEGFTIADVWFVDDGIVPSSFTISSASTGPAPYGGITLNGLWAHNGETVSAYLIGLDCGDFTVTNGSIFVPFGDGVSAGSGDGLFTLDLVAPYVNVQPLPMCVGFTFTSDGQLVRPATAADSGARAGPAFGKKRRVQQYIAQLYGAVNGSIEFGAAFDRLKTANLRTKGGQAYTKQQFYYGIHRDALTADEDFDGMLCWRVTRPHPCFVVALGGFLHTEDA